MDHVTCPSCGDDIVPCEPDRGAWKVVVAFWVFTLMFGIAAYMWPWAFLLVVAWLGLAMIGMRVGMRSKEWTCPRCDAPVPYREPAVV
jgi:hypothetical protein